MNQSFINRLISLVIGSFLVATISAFHLANAQGGIATDGTMGAAHTLSGTNVTIPQNLGATVGGNLFHSFRQFNVQSGQTVTFTENTTNSLNNVISRVTGGSSSDINGLIRSTPGGHANFFLINPAGVVFGKDAQIDVPGAFHVSTANNLKFADGAVLSANLQNASTLSSVEPSSFGFLASSPNNNGLLQVQGAQLAVKDKQALDLVAGNIQTSNNATLAAPAGEIRLVAMQSAGDVSLTKTDGALPLPEAMPNLTNAGEISSQDTFIKTTGDSGGRVGLWGGEVTLTTQDPNNLHGIDAFNTGTTDANSAKGVSVKGNTIELNGTRIRTESRNTGKAGDIQLLASQDIGIYQGGRIQSYTNADRAGDTGNITLTAGRDIVVDGINTPAGFTTYLVTGSYDVNAGDAGDINLYASRNVTISNKASVYSVASGHSAGNAGNEIVQANGDFHLNNSTIANYVFDADTSNSGDITVQAHGNIQISKDSLIKNYTETKGRVSTISVTADGDITNGGDIYIMTKHGDASADSGSINVKSQGNITITQDGGIDSYTDANRNATNLNVVAGKNLVIDGYIESRNTNYGNPPDQLASGNSGNISVHADGDILMTGANGEIKELGVINSSPSYNEYGYGNAGNIDIYAGGKLSLVKAALISANVYEKAHAGNIEIFTHGDINIENLSSIGSSSSLAGTGSAGTIKLVTDGNLTLNERGGISTSTSSDMDAGNILIDVKGNLNLINKSFIFNSSMPPFKGSQIIAKGNSGLLSVHALGNINLSDFSGISADTYGLGNGGSVKVSTPNTLELKDSSAISTVTKGLGTAGKLEVDVNNLSVNNGSQISTASITENSSGQTGQLLINASGLVSMNNGSINSFNAAVLSDTALKLIIPGTLTVNAKDIDMTNKSGISTYAGGNAAAGNIYVNYTGALTQSESSSIATAAQSGNGGNLTIHGGNLLSLNNAYLSTMVFSGQGNGGDVAISGVKNLQMHNNSLIETKTAAAGTAGNVDIQAGTITLEKSTISSGASATDSSGITGKVNLNAENRIDLTNSLISIENRAVLKSSVNQLAPGAINLAAKDIHTAGSIIATSAYGNTNAGNININASRSLIAESSGGSSTYIQTNTNTGNGGAINIHDGGLFRLDKSFLTTTVAAGQGNGGNISIDTTGDVRIKNNGGFIPVPLPVALRAMLAYMQTIFYLIMALSFRDLFKPVQVGKPDISNYLQITVS